MNWRRHQRKILAPVVLVLALGLAHETVLIATRIRPPEVTLVTGAVHDEGGIRRMGAAYARMTGGVREVYLEGSPERIGTGMSRLLYERMVDNENVLWKAFSHYVPLAPARALIMDVSRVEFRGVDRGFPDDRRREVAAQAKAFDPDPFADRLPTYHRMVFLQSLYDISLSFEHSPLIGCSAFGLGPTATADGHTLFARAFDLEAGEIFDRDKAVFFVREDGRIPFASVAWPGLVGVLSGMNLEGVAIEVNGARAKEPTTDGEPVVFALREVLEHAHDTKEAVAILRRQRVMVSHIVFVGDAKGNFAIVERAPGVEAFARESFPDPDRVAITNHFEGPLKDDPKNREVLAETTTLPRRQRVDEMLGEILPGTATVEQAVAMLRDHTCANGVACEIGDRRTVDAIIATHGIVADTTDRTLWVSAGPHLSGAFVRFDLRRIFAPGHDPKDDPAPELIAADPILKDGRFEAGQARAGGPRIGGDMKP